LPKVSACWKLFVVPAKQPQIPEASSWRVSKGLVAGAALVVAIAALTVLAIVAAVKDVDTLSTVALTLAILAFVIQILVFVVQGYTANAQMLQAQTLHGQMTTVLGQIRTQAKGTQTAVDKMSDQLLSAALGKAAAEAGGDALTSPRFAARVQEIVRESLGAASAEASVALGTSEVEESYPPAAPDPEIVATMMSWPPEEAAEAAVEVFRSLSPAGRRSLFSFASDELTTRLQGASLGPGLFADPVDEIVEAGLVERAHPTRRRAGYYLHQLTDLGRSVGRLLMAPEPPPPYLQDAFDQLVAPVREAAAREAPPVS
jgi:hypothetical protein